MPRLEVQAQDIETARLWTVYDDGFLPIEQLCDVREFGIRAERYDGDTSPMIFQGKLQSPRRRKKHRLGLCDKCSNHGRLRDHRDTGEGAD